MQLSFQPPQANDPQCVDISITNDDILEDNEVFIIELHTTDQDVTLDPQNATVTILNEDRKR